MSRIELKPCAICGEQAKVVKVVEPKTNGSKAQNIFYYASCTNRDCSNWADEPNEYDSEEAAAKHWNADAILKPCPFCGSQATIRKNESTLINRPKAKKIYFFPSCTNFDCPNYFTALDEDLVEFPSEETASNAWNNDLW